MVKRVGVKRYVLALIDVHPYEVVIVKQHTDDGRIVELAFSPDEARVFSREFKRALEELEERM